MIDFISIDPTGFDLFDQPKIGIRKFGFPQERELSPANLKPRLQDLTDATDASAPDPRELSRACADVVVAVQKGGVRRTT
jgi:hypothetical protein